MLLSVLGHHSEPGDPVILAWIKHELDALLGLGPGAVVAILGVIIVAIPLGVLAVFLTQRARQNRP